MRYLLDFLVLDMGLTDAIHVQEIEEDAAGITLNEVNAALHRMIQPAIIARLGRCAQHESRAAAKLSHPCAVRRVDGRRAPARRCVSVSRLWWRHGRGAACCRHYTLHKIQRAHHSATKIQRADHSATHVSSRMVGALDFMQH
jgi:hypothetical protein